MSRVLVCLLALLLCGPAWSAPVTITANAEVRATPEGLIAVYRLSRPVNRFVFGRAVEDIREQGWTLSDGFRWDGAAVVAKDGKAFRRFEIRIRPDSEQRDRIYPALTRVGADGWLIYQPYLVGAKDQGMTRLTLAPLNGWTGLPDKGVKAAEGSGGFVYLGPAAQVTAEDTSIVAGPEVPPWLLSTIRGRGEALAAYYARRLGVALPTPPLVIVNYRPGSGGDFRGDVTPGRVVSLRFQGDPWAVEDATAARGITGLVGHEYFHFWNADLFKPRDFDGEAWLHEGAAEYISLLAALELGDLDEAGMRTALGRRLTACAGILGERSLTADPPRGGSGVYDCGVVAAWSADLQVRAASDGRRDVVDLWRDVFEATGPARIYDADTFSRRLDAPAGSPWRTLMTPGGGASRWPGLLAAMKPLGVEVDAARSPIKDRAALLFHLMGLSCGEGAVGFFGDSDHLKLDGPDSCGPLKSGMLVDAFEGRSLMTDASDAFDAGQAACAAGRSVQLTFKGKPAGGIVCNKPLGPPPADWTVTRWRQIGP